MPVSGQAARTLRSTGRSPMALPRKVNLHAVRTGRSDAGASVTDPADSAIRLDGVKRAFRTKKGTYVALEDVSFDVPRGEFLAVVGPSGCGKSTLLSLICGLARPNAGTVEVFGQPVTSLRRDVGFIFQRDALLPWRTALQNVALPLRFRGADKRSATDIARNWLAKVGLRRFESSFPHQLSGGMRKRVAIAATLAYEPPVLLLDEPFSALDVETRTIMENDLLKLWELNRPTVVFITHDLAEAVGLADRVLVMTAGPGRVIGDHRVDLGRPRDLLDLRFDEKFVDLQHRIWTQLREQVMKAQERERD
jgi:NitT/TauT family transport system ATP-binding protein